MEQIPTPDSGWGVVLGISGGAVLGLVGLLIAYLKWRKP